MTLQNRFFLYNMHPLLHKNTHTRNKPQETSHRKLPNFYEKVTDFLLESYRISKTRQNQPVNKGFHNRLEMHKYRISARGVSSCHTKTWWALFKFLSFISPNIVELTQQSDALRVIKQFTNLVSQRITLFEMYKKSGALKFLLLRFSISMKMSTIYSFLMFGIITCLQNLHILIAQNLQKPKKAV